jgi:nitrite reductase/ring-hydroxylating ferredoxin subunit/uncharacterized membrane protein
MDDQNVTLKEQIDHAISNLPVIKEAGSTVKNTLHQIIISDQRRREVADFLHGTWLGHPLHPVLTDVTIGAWSFAAVFDALSILSQSPGNKHAADTLTVIGTVSALGTAITGITDYSAIKKDAVAHGTLHGLMNMVGFVMYVGSIIARHKRNRGLGIALSTASLGMLLASAWLGGEMVYRHRVGVNHAPNNIKKPERWTSVMDADTLKIKPQRVEVDGEAVMLYRKGDDIYAIGAVCSHAGGPLEQGKIENMCVQCPWHDSVYDLHDGSVVHGPSTYNQPAYDARIYRGKIQVRVRQPKQDAITEEIRRISEKMDANS